MPRKTLIALVCVAVLPGCARLADSRLNPFTWFGGPEDAAVDAASADRVDADAARAGVPPLVRPGMRQATVDQRALVAQVTGAEILPVAGGQVVRATGLAAGPGPYNAQLVETGRGDGVLTLAFRTATPDTPVAAPGAAGREVTVAAFFTGAELAGVRRVRVEGQAGAREVRP